MTEQKPDSNLKEQDHRKWVEGQSTEALEKEILREKRWLTFIQYVKSVIEQIMEEIEASRTVEGKWEREKRKLLARMIRIEEMELAAMGPEERARAQAEIDRVKLTAAKMGAASRSPREAPQGVLDRHLEASKLEASQHLEVLRRELTARRIQELSKKEASTHESKRKKRPVDPDSNLGRRRKIIRQNPGLEAIDYCVLFENSHITFPQGSHWDPYRPYQWPKAYRMDETLSGYIRSMTTKDKKKM